MTSIEKADTTASSSDPPYSSMQQSIALTPLFSTKGAEEVEVTLLMATSPWGNTSGIPQLKHHPCQLLCVAGHWVTMPGNSALQCLTQIKALRGGVTNSQVGLLFLPHTPQASVTLGNNGDVCLHQKSCIPKRTRLQGQSI